MISEALILEGGGGARGMRVIMSHEHLLEYFYSISTLICTRKSDRRPTSDSIRMIS